MAVKDIVTYPDPRLREKCADVVDFTTPEFLALGQDLVDTLGNFGALGIAAPQIGVNLRVFLINVDNKPQFFINPIITKKEGTSRAQEGCLSFLNVFEMVDRSAKVSVEAIDIDGREFVCNLDGTDAVAFQHELDHLDGILFIDRVSTLTKSFMLKKLKKFKKKYNID